MRIIHIFVLSLISLSLAVFTVHAAEFKRLTKEAEFIQSVADKKLVASWGWVTAGDNGVMTGKSPLGKIEGEWNWKGKYFCRTITSGSNNPGRDCQSVHISGKNVVFIRDRGKGEQSAFKIK